MAGAAGGASGGGVTGPGAAGCGPACPGVERSRQVIAHGSHSTMSPTAVGAVWTSGASSAAYSTNAAGGSTRRSGKTRPSACGQYVPQWMGTAARGRMRRSAWAARSGSRWRPRPSVGPQPQTGQQRHVDRFAELAHPVEQVRVAGEVDRDPAADDEAERRRRRTERRPVAGVDGGHGTDRDRADHRPARRPRSPARHRSRPPASTDRTRAGTNIGTSRPRWRSDGTSRWSQCRWEMSTASMSRSRSRAGTGSTRRNGPTRARVTGSVSRRTPSRSMTRAEWPMKSRPSAPGQRQPLRAASG